MNSRLLFTALALVALANVAAAQSFITNYSSFQNWLPVVFIGIMFSITITGIYYIIGMFLNNKRVKATAIGELGQAVGTGIITMVIIAVFVMFGAGQLSLVSLLSPSSMVTLCNQIASSVATTGFSFLYSSGNPTQVICSQISAINSGTTTPGDLTPQIDYGLFSSYVIISNLTNQAANNLNAFYIFTGWIGFLKEFESFTEVCGFPGTCALPIVGVPEFSVAYKYKPYAGYSSIESMIQPAQFESVLSFDIMILQLLMITIFIIIWPYLLAAGIVLRSTFFTRRTGGLLMAMSLAAVMIFPIMYAMEYAAFSSGYISGIGPIGASDLPSMPLYQKVGGVPGVYGVPSAGNGGYMLSGDLQGNPCSNAGKYVYENICGYNGTVDDTPVCVDASAPHSPLCCTSTVGAPCTATPGANINFFVLPNLTRVLDYHHCYIDNLAGSEAVFAVFYLIPLVGAIGSIGTLVSQVPTTPLDWPLGGCTSKYAIRAALGITNLYGITFVSSVMFPLINILVALAAMSGLATLFGGDTDILGLSKLI